MPVYREMHIHIAFRQSRDIHSQRPPAPDISIYRQNDADIVLLLHNGSYTCMVMQTDVYRCRYTFAGDGICTDTARGVYAHRIIYIYTATHTHTHAAHHTRLL